MSIRQKYLKKGDVKEKPEKNIDFISAIGPAGGLSFTDEKFVKTGTGYEACIYLYEYPSMLPAYWLSHLTGIKDSVFVMDIASLDKTQVKENLRKSLDEQRSRIHTAKSTGDALDARHLYEQMQAMYEEVNSFGEVMKAILIRLYVPAKTVYEVDVKLKEILKELGGGQGYKAGVCLHETKADFRNAFLSYSQQQDIHGRKGQPITSTAIAGGNPFHFSSLKDPNGMYYGMTKTGGAVLLDFFRVTEKRMSYNFLIAGKMGAGKSTILKKICTDMAIRQNYLRVFDPTGEFAKLTEYLGGRVIYLDGTSDSALNMLQILPDENDKVAYAKHLNRVLTIYKYLKKGDVSENEELVLKQVLRVLYIYFKIIDQKGNIIRNLRDMKNDEFPVIKDLLDMTRYMINHYDEEGDKIIEISNIRESRKDILEDIELKLEDLCSIYGDIFNRHTKIEKFYDNKLVTFVFNNLIDMEESIYDAQFYNALTLCWDSGVANGVRMKELYRTGRIAEEDICRTEIIVDEAHRSVNANKRTGVREVEFMMREGRKYYIGLGLASQLIADWVPDDSSAEGVGDMKKLFELATYKMVFHQDESSIGKLREVFSNSFPEEVIRKIPLLTKGDCFLSIASDRMIELSVYASKEELYVFDGGQ